MKSSNFKSFGARKWLCAIGSALAVLWLGQATGAAEIPLTTPDGFAVPQPGQVFIFPRDHGSHPEYAIEWWYLTGHLFTTNQAEFGFQATFFRRALALPGATNDAGSSTFGDDQLYLAHAALVDRTSGIFRHQERLNRAGWDAAAATNTLAVRNGNWQLHLDPEKSGGSGHEVMDLQFTVGADVALELTLTPRKHLVIFGTNGVSRKAADLTASSHYLTFSRLAAGGTLTLDETNLAVTGEAWMDHEFSSSQLGQGQIGWDWLCLQLFDGRELMAYRMRRADGQTDPFSTVAWVDAQAVVHQTGPDRFKWTALQHWHSPHSGADYPSLVQLEADNPVAGKTETFLVEPIVADQELGGNVGGVVYWEGACRVLDANHQEIGRAYMELTGYGESMKGKF